MIAWAMLAGTLVLVAAGCVLYALGFAGYAQLLWVLASGTAGGTIALFIESRLPPPLPPGAELEHWERQPP